MHVKIIGGCCQTTAPYEAVVKDVYQTLNVSYTLEVISDNAELEPYGIIKGPAIVVDETVVAVSSVPLAKHLLKRIEPLI